MEINIVIAGVGGQGVVTAGTLISQASLAMGYNVVMSEIHGLAQRGGSVTVDVRIGDVKSPIIPSGDVDLIIGMEPMEAVRAAENAGRNTLMLINDERVSPVALTMKGLEYPDLDGLLSEAALQMKVLMLDALPMALEAGDSRAVSTVMVGAAMQSGILPFDRNAAFKALSGRFSGKIYEINEKALDLGIAATLGTPLKTH